MITQPHPNTIKETITNESSMPSQAGTQRFAKDMKITVAVSSRDLVKGAGEGSQRTGGAAAEYGLAEDGGIFQPALIRNTSMEEG